MPKERIGIEVAQRIFLSGEVLLRLALIGFVALLVSQFFVAASRAAEPLSALRVWPAQDYTRITLESKNPIRYNLLVVKDPERLVLDLVDLDFQSVQKEISGKVLPDDPYIASLRAGRFMPGVVRVVLDLKKAVNPQIFTLKPVAEYGHRLVLDVYPSVPIDPLMALLARPESRVEAAPPASPAAPSIQPRPPDAAHPAADPKKPGAAESAPQAADAAGAGARAGPIIARLVTVALDAGHGGEDPGAKGRGGSREKNVTLVIARKLKSIIDAEPNMRAVLTRDGDFYLPLATRVHKARRVRADLFVSIHADAFVRPHARGSSVFALSERGATSAAARWLARKENEADLIGGVNLDVKDRHLAQTLLDLSQTATIQDSIKLARAVLSELGGVNTLHKDNVEQAGFAVLKAPDIPSILVETAFISNPEEERRLNDEAYQEKIAQAIFRGIRRYFTRNPALSRPTLATLQ